MYIAAIYISSEAPTQPLPDCAIENRSYMIYGQ